MSYSVSLMVDARRKIDGWSLPDFAIRVILDGLDRLATHPARQLIRVGPADDPTMQLDLIGSYQGEPAREFLSIFTVLYGVDEETLHVVECERLFDDTID